MSARDASSVKEQSRLDSCGASSHAGFPAETALRGAFGSLQENASLDLCYHLIVMHNSLSLYHECMAMAVALVTVVVVVVCVRFVRAYVHVPAAG